MRKERVMIFIDGSNPKTYWEQQKFFNELKKIPNFNVVLCKLRKHKRKNGNYVF